MYSFEGKFRTTPTVSLGGKSQQDKLNKERLLRKAHNERQKREEIRKRLHSALVLQSCIRSYLVRRRLKRQLRQQFDQERLRVAENRDISALHSSVRLLRFFYNTKDDGDRLTWLGQNLLKNKEKWISSSYSGVFLQSEILCIFCKFLEESSSPTIAIPLRMLETFTSEDLLQPKMKTGRRDFAGNSLFLWEKLVKNGYFSCLLHLLATKVPSNLEPGTPSRSNPPTPLAGTLLSLIARPILLSGKIADAMNDHVDLTMHDDQRSLATKRIETIVKFFIRRVLCKTPSPQLYYFIFPALSCLPHFPLSLVLRFLEVEIRDPVVMKSPGLPAAVMKLAAQSLDSLSPPSFRTYLCCLQCLIMNLPKIRADDADSDLDSDDEMDDDSAENMAVDFSYGSKGSTIPMSEMVHDCHLFLTTNEFIDACVNRKIHEQENSSSLDSICAVCYYLLAVSRTSVSKNKLLYTLAFSSSFLRKLWQSTISSTTTNKVTGQRIELIQLLLKGSPMTQDESRSIQFKLVVFCTLFAHNLLSVHDTDFYSIQESPKRYMAFSTFELVSVALTIRDVCLSLIKLALPETRIKYKNYDQKAVVHALSFGRSIHFEKYPSGGSKESDVDPWELNDIVFLFTVSRRLVKLLHTRDVRRSFMPNYSWLSNSILVKIDQSNDFAQRWHRRSERNSAVAAHLANTTDEDVVLSTAEARQLAVLMNVPFVIPFETRVSIFTTMLRKDRDSRETTQDLHREWAGLETPSRTNEVTVRREFLYEDAFNDLSEENAPDLRKRLRVTFVNPAGVEEAGYGAGVTREFLQQVMKAGFDPLRGYFSTTVEGRLYPNPNAAAVNPASNEHFYFLGRMLGKVIYEGMQVELPFAAFFLCKILQRKNADVDINHLQSLDPDFYKNLMYLRVYDGDVSDLNLNFTVADESFGVTKVNELIHDGKNTPVTNANKVLYMHMMANYKLNIQMRQPCLHFRRGLESVVMVDWLHMFNYQEFQTLVSGAEVPIDIGDLRRHAVYSGGYSDEDDTIQAFWKVLEELTNEQLSQFLLFVTSCSRPPLLGFKELHPPFCIQKGGSSDRLPTASTCLNLLKLPEYEDAKSLKTKLLQSLQSGTGFELS